MSRSHDLGETLANVIDLVAKRLDADVCSIYLSDGDLRHLTLSATNGLEPGSVKKVRLAFGEGLVGMCAQRGEPVAYEHAREDPNYRYFPETGEERYESLLAAPLIVQSVTTGVLVIQTLESRGFDQSDVELMQTCAQLLAPVVVNAQLLAMVTNHAEDRAQIIGETTDRLLIPPAPHARAKRLESNAELRGIPTARGVAIGPVYRLEAPVDLAHLDYEPSASAEEESSDLMDALVESRREIDEMRSVVGERFGPEFAAVFYTQMQILEDTGFVQQLQEAVQNRRNALQALTEVLDAYRATFEAIEDPYFRERGADVQEVGRRVMARLLGVRHHQTPLQDGAIVVVEQIFPELFARLEMDKVSALVSEHGGATSHGAIFARTLEIPAITGVSGVLAEARAGEMAIVDGSAGRIYLSPDDALLGEYQSAQRKYAIAVEHLDALRERPAETLDGRRIVLSANVGLINDLRLINQHGAEGVGLFRTELLALAHRGFPSEEEQEQLYERVVSQMAGRSVTIRTLDLGGDKGLPNIGLEPEENPQLGCRSIRLILDNKRAFRAQLRAIFRASSSKTVKLLLPMISGVGELREARAVIDEVREQLERRGEAFDRDLPVGIMIEVPSAALISQALARECDFFSIGTNDLTQYTLAADRGNERVAHLYNPLHPAVLSLIDMSVRAANGASIPISVCGEVATNPLAVPILIGLGIDELSGAPGAVPIVKEIVRALDSQAVREDARQALAAESPEEVEAIAAARLRHAGLLDHPDLGDWLRSIFEEQLGGV
ncbi:MAG: phosphoenolpyruvate--protein phosphotransferase [Deltaproteobacteria bacterium]|nr:phosphoenolpyruvate--protein phosphotransferase [Deltaproteobacteria bacterium]MBW2722805.1 phosphoenolpyruvate--protein phosphotransferase [Deltaproteobacteria bacterium]